ncbi:MAG: DUF4293 domain-containing protein [Phocaeicola sp.]
MIQRIQTIYLLAVTILLVVAMCLPIGTFVNPDLTLTELSNLCLTEADGTKDYAPWALFALLLASSTIALGSIFLFKNRILQIRLTVFNIVLQLGYYGTVVAFMFLLKEGSSFSFSFTVALPFIAIVLNWLAIRAIGKDEMLVKAYDRLR